MSNMKVATVRQVQHDLAALLEEVRKGKEIVVTKRGQVIARIVPAYSAKGRIAWPDSAARMKRLGPKAVRGTAASRIIHDAREERL
jgi:prevent-host-death family protein